MKIGRYLIGILSGLTFGMLFAPRRGSDLRKEILEKGSEDHMEGLKVLGNAFKGAGADMMKELKALAEQEDVAALLDVSKEKMHKFLEAAQDKGYDAADFVQEKLEDLAGVARERAEGVRGEAEAFKKRAVRKAESVKKTVEAKVAKVRKTVAKKAGKKK